ncbi:unnamed protein product [Nezara viridula]|uniref:Neurotransmitter-gated ion-channel transmembrane domain-containing protein n=1 Tax=Nezara viridula TaxID=85310 RepID=A0A9P0E7X9_NEZVI|nr:unnamed protein product [Nezara viridula]
MLLINFHLQRHMGNFLIQVYGPCVLLVVLSWVSFWLNREATADRVSLGITTVLTMTFLGLEARTDLPKVPYPTALDFFVFLSFVFIFATIIQFAVVHYFTKYGSGECYFSSDLSSDESSSDDEVWTTNDSHLTERNGRKSSSSSTGRKKSQNHPSNLENTYLEVIPLSACTISSLNGRRESWTTGLSSCLGCPNPEEVAERSVSPPQTKKPHSKRRRKRTPRFNSVSKIDRASRIVFPLCFLAINLFYWYTYLYRSERIRKK